jgi:anti-anti-sigma regulatory factor
MLKITRDRNPAGGGAILLLEGRVAGQWVDELRRAYEEDGRDARTPITFDLRDVTFIDATGVAFFRDVSERATLINCSLFAAEQLKTILTRHERYDDE